MSETNEQAADPKAEEPKEAPGDGPEDEDGVTEKEEEKAVAAEDKEATEDKTENSNPENTGESEQIPEKKIDKQETEDEGGVKHEAAGSEGKEGEGSEKKNADPDGGEAKDGAERAEGDEEDKEKIVFKSGDWYCQGCGVHNFAKRSQCMSCGHMKLSAPAPGKETVEWECPSCQCINPSRRVNCRHCLFNPMLAKQFMTHPLQYTRGGAAAASSHHHVHYPQMPSFGSGGFGPPRSHLFPPHPSDYRQSPYSMGLMGMGMGMGPSFGSYGFGSSMYPDYYSGFDYYSQMGKSPYDSLADWDCWVCGHLNYAKRTKCKTCETEKDKALPRSGGGAPRPGDWFCMACQNVNFSKRQECKMCTAPRSTSSNEIVLQRLRGYAL